METDEGSLWCGFDLLSNEVVHHILKFVPIQYNILYGRVCARFTHISLAIFQAHKQETATYMQRRALGQHTVAAKANSISEVEQIVREMKDMRQRRHEQEDHASYFIRTGQMQLLEYCDNNVLIKWKPCALEAAAGTACNAVQVFNFVHSKLVSCKDGLAINWHRVVISAAKSMNAVLFERLMRSDEVAVESLGPALGFYLLRWLHHSQTYNAKNTIYTWMETLCREYKWHRVHTTYAMMNQQNRVLEFLRGRHIHVVVTPMNQRLAKIMRIQIGPRLNCYYSVPQHPQAADLHTPWADICHELECEPRLVLFYLSAFRIAYNVNPPGFIISDVDNAVTS